MAMSARTRLDSLHVPVCLTNVDAQKRGLPSTLTIRTGHVEFTLAIPMSLAEMITDSTVPDLLKTAGVPRIEGDCRDRIGINM